MASSSRHPGEKQAPWCFFPSRFCPSCPTAEPPFPGSQPAGAALDLPSRGARLLRARGEGGGQGGLEPALACTNTHSTSLNLDPGLAPGSGHSSGGSKRAPAAVASPPGIGQPASASRATDPGWAGLPGAGRTVSARTAPSSQASSFPAPPAPPARTGKPGRPGQRLQPLWLHHSIIGARRRTRLWAVPHEGCPTNGSVPSLCRRSPSAGANCSAEPWTRRSWGWGASGAGSVSLAGTLTPASELQGITASPERALAGSSGEAEETLGRQRSLSQLLAQPLLPSPACGAQRVPGDAGTQRAWAGPCPGKAGWAWASPAGWTGVTGYGDS